MRRRTFLASTVGVGTALVAGCSGGPDGTDGDPTDGGGSGSGTFRLLVSDQPTAIEDFESLDVTISSARVFRADDDETITTAMVNGTVTDSPTSPPNGTTDAETDEDEDGGFVTFDLDDVTVDLTGVIGDRAVSILEGKLEEGRYSGIELHVSDAEGVVDGETVDVTVPSDRLRIIKPFEIAADAELSFVFDIEVVQRGPNGGYNLLPVIGKSGVSGSDVDVEEVDDEDAEPTATGTDAATSTGDAGTAS